MSESAGTAKVKCATHNTVFSGPADRGFHEALNAGCRWEEVREPGRSRDRMLIAVVVGAIWAALTMALGLMLH